MWMPPLNRVKDWWQRLRIIGSEVSAIYRFVGRSKFMTGWSSPQGTNQQLSFPFCLFYSEKSPVATITPVDPIQPPSKRIPFFNDGETYHSRFIKRIKRKLESQGVDVSEFKRRSPKPDPIPPVDLNDLSFESILEGYGEKLRASHQQKIQRYVSKLQKAGYDVSMEALANAPRRVDRHITGNPSFKWWQIMLADIDYVRLTGNEVTGPDLVKRLEHQKKHAERRICLFCNTVIKNASSSDYPLLICCDDMLAKCKFNPADYISPEYISDGSEFTTRSLHLIFRSLYPNLQPGKDQRKASSFEITPLDSQQDWERGNAW